MSKKTFEEIGLWLLIFLFGSLGIGLGRQVVPLVHRLFSSSIYYGMTNYRVKGTILELVVSAVSIILLSLGYTCIRAQFHKQLIVKRRDSWKLIVGWFLVTFSVATLLHSVPNFLVNLILIRQSPLSAIVTAV